LAETGSVLSADHIFPTRSRTKLAKSQSYPIGAEALSRALAGVPQHDQIACDFYAGNPSADKHKDRIFVMRVAYQKQARAFHHAETAHNHGVFDPRWTISVYGVATVYRNDVKTALLEIGLPDFARNWLVENDHLTGKTGGATLWLEFDVIEKRLIKTQKANLEPDRA
jgi:hypothetical protein